MSRFLAVIAVSVWGVLAVALGGPSDRFAPEGPAGRVDESSFVQTR